MVLVTMTDMQPFISTSSIRGRKPSDRSLLVLVLALFAFIGAAILSFSNFQVGTFTDDATYVVLARSLARGEGFALGNFPAPIPESTFPPGYPLLLVPLAYLWPQSFLPMQVASIMATLGTIFIFWMMSSDRSVIKLSQAATYVAVFLFALHPWVVGSSSMVMSEAAYTALSLVTILTLWQLERFVKWRWPLLILLAVLLNLGIAVRTVGFSLVIASLFYLLIVRKDVRTSVLLGGTWVILYIPLFLHNTKSGGGILSTGYAQQTATATTLVDKLVQVGANLWNHLSVNLPYFLVPLPEVPLISSIALGAALVLVIILGTRRLTQKGYLIAVYLASYTAGILLFWNPSVGSAQTRFLLPILPFMILLTAAGCEEVLFYADSQSRRHSTIRLRRTVAILMVLAVFLLYLGRNVQARLDPIKDRMTNLAIGTTWIADNAPHDVIVACQDPVPMSLYTGSYTVPYPTNSAESFLDSILHKDIDYLVIAPRLAPIRSVELDANGSIALQAVQHSPDHFRLVFQDISANVAVYEIVTTEDDSTNSN